MNDYTVNYKINTDVAFIKIGDTLFCCNCNIYNTIRKCANKINVPTLNPVHKKSLYMRFT